MNLFSKLRLLKTLRLITLSAIIVAPTVLAASQPELRVATSFSIIADWVTQVGAPYVQVKSIVPPKNDVHNYQLTTQDAREVAKADLLFINGLGFDDRMKKLVDTNKLVITSAGIQPLINTEDEHEDEDEHDALQGMDPHAWQDLSNVKIYLYNIVNALSAKLPERKRYFTGQASAYLEEVAALDTLIKTQINKIPPSKRSVATQHDAFGYFTHAYGLAFVSLQGINRDAQASAARMSNLIKQIREQKVSAIFTEFGSNTKLLQALSKETGVVIGGELYADTLTTHPHPAATYLGMIRTNLAQIEKAFALAPLQ